MLNDRPRWDHDGAHWPHRDASRFVSAGGLRWHVQEMGAGPVVLLLHGTGAATHSWRGLMPLLAADFRVVAVDLPGHGFTTGRPPGGLGMVAMARALGPLIEALDVEPRLVIGHSAGSAIAVRMALDGVAAPAAIIGINPALLPFPGVAARIFPAMARMLFVNPFVPHMFAALARQPGEVGRFLKRSTGSAIDAEGVDCYRRLFGCAGHCAGAITMMADWDLETLAADLPRLRTPLLLIHGAADAMIPASAMLKAAARIPGAQTEELAALGHLAHEEAPDRVAALVRRFAAQLAA